MASSTLLPFNYKTSLCSLWNKNSDCHRGERCRYAHGSDELRAPAEGKQLFCRRAGFCLLGKQCHFSHSVDEWQTAPGFKTKLCDSFMKAKLCSRGPGCHFAHEDSELMPHNPTADHLAAVKEGILSTTLRHNVGDTVYAAYREQLHRGLALHEVCYDMKVLRGVGAGLMIVKREDWETVG